MGRILQNDQTQIYKNDHFPCKKNKIGKKHHAHIAFISP